ncbi:MAG TPA: flagellin FliC [Planctomycetes bacterium]|nr:flagellin FliC [Planctomycetota bacterium]
MGLRVNTNISSIAAQRQLAAVSNRLSDNYQRLASGMRIASAADDPAGLGISERMRAQLKSLAQASRNGQDGVSLVQTAEGALNEANANLTRMRELAIAAANGTLNTGDRATLNAEFTALTEEIDRLATSTQFNGVSLLNNAGATIDIQIGSEKGEVISLALADTTLAGLNLTGSSFDITTVTNATNLLSTIDAAIDTLTTTRGALGASQNRLQTAIRSLGNAEENLSAAESRIRDVDVALETADLTRNTILQQAAVSVLSQANLQPQIALSLLQG